MTDNLFDRLADLFRSAGPVNWRLAREVAESVAGTANPIDPWSAEQLRELAGTAQRLVAAGTPLDTLTVDQPVIVLDRRAWAGEAVTGLEYIAEAVADRLGGMTGELGPLMQQLAPSLVGMQTGALVGLVSRRALGSFDRGLIAGSSQPVSFVSENIDALASAHDLDLQQVRLWVALREVAHLALIAIPWVLDHLHMLAHAHAEAMDLDASSVEERLRAVQDPEAMQRLLDGDESGIEALASDAEPSLEAEALAAFLAVIDGYGAVATERAGAAYLPDLDRISQAAHEARTSAAAAESVASGFVGVAVDPADALAAASFCREVARRWGDEALERIWEGPEATPTLAELTDATGWAARVLLTD